MTQTGPETQDHRTQRSKHPRRRLWTGLACLVLLLLVAVVSLKPARWFEPRYQGRPVSHWFEKFVAYTNLQPGVNIPHYEVFREMEGDAVPFLIKSLEPKPSRFDDLYAAFNQRLPPAIRNFLPQARNELYYRARCNAAIRLLSSIGFHQRFNHEAGWPVTPPLASSAQPRLLELLNDEDQGTRQIAVYALGSFGPAAAEAVPALIQFAPPSSDAEWFMASMALAEIGPPASNAVEVLIEILENDRNSVGNQELAIHALGKIGPAAHPALPLLLPLLGETRIDNFRRAGASAIVRIGITPDEAVPLLNRMRNSTNNSLRMPAMLALWNHDPDDPVLTQELKTAFASDPHSLLTLASDSPHASRFLPEIKSLLDHPDENTRRNAARAVRKINTPPQ